MQIPPTTALLNALSVTGAQRAAPAPAPGAAPAARPAAPTGALAAAHKALAARGLAPTGAVSPGAPTAAGTIRPRMAEAQGKVAVPSTPPSPNLPRGSIVDIVV